MTPLIVAAGPADGRHARPSCCCRSSVGADARQATPRAVRSARLSRPARRGRSRRPARPARSRRGGSGPRRSEAAHARRCARHSRRTTRRTPHRRASRASPRAPRRIALVLPTAATLLYVTSGAPGSPDRPLAERRAERRPLPSSARSRPARWSKSWRNSRRSWRAARTMPKAGSCSAAPT